MRVSTIFCSIIERNKKVKVDADTLRTEVQNFFYTIDCINKLGRFDTMLTNGHQVDEYRIHKCFKGFVFPAAVTVGTGNAWEDFLDRDYTLCGEWKDGKEPRLLSPMEFVDTMICIYNVMKVTLVDSDFEPINRKEQVVQDGSYYQLNRKSVVKDMITVFPIPITQRLIRERYEMTPIDDEYVREYLTENCFNTLLKRHSS